jgi:hypothetical protein
MSQPFNIGRPRFFEKSRTIEALKANFFDPDKVIKAVDKAMYRKLSRFGAFVRTRSRSSIRKRKAVSEPGTPPTNRTGLLKKFIYFAYDEQTKTVIIGPAAFREGASVPELLEYGGRGTVSKYIRRRGQDLVQGIWKPRPYMRPAYDEELPAFLATLKDSVKG